VLLTTVCGNVPDKGENLCSVSVLSIVRDNDGEWGARIIEKHR
jgi:hypothetical protein